MNNEFLKYLDDQIERCEKVRDDGTTYFGKYDIGNLHRLIETRRAFLAIERNELNKFLLRGN
jgi:hypothetical protein